MIIGAGVLQVPVILQAKKMGLKVISIDLDPNAPGFKFSDLSYIISTNDINQAIKTAKQLQIDGVMTNSDMPCRTAAAIAKELGLYSMTEETAKVATNKGLMRIRLKENNVPIPEFFVVDNFNDFVNVCRQFNNSFIVKPADNSGSRGVMLCENNADLKAVYDYSSGCSKSGEIMVEEFMTGHEVSVETLTIEGNTHIIAITDKLTTGSPNFVEMGHSIQSMLPEQIKNEIKDVAEAAVNAIGIYNGPSHTEIMVTDSGPKVVEIAARLGGDYITSTLVPLATGVNMIEACIKIAMGEETDVKTKYNKGSAIRFFNSPLGRLKSITGVEIARGLNGIIEVGIYKSVGDSIDAVHGSTDRIGYVIAQADTAKEAIDICELAASKVKFETEV